ncbi:MAG: peptidylprolyl isomerase [Armatimonadota bacterium]
MTANSSRLVKTIAVIAIAALLLAIMAAGCNEEPQQAEAPPFDEPVDETVADADPADDEAAAEEETTVEADDEQAAAEPTGEDAENVNTIVKIKTGKGDMTAELYDEKMPITAGNFLLLIDEGFYEDLTFHRVVPDFVIQGGDPAGDGTGGPDWAIPLEKPGEIKHERGILSMARSQQPDSAGSQFFVCLSNNESVRALDSLQGGYAAFGKVTEGVDVAQSIEVGDALDGIEIISESPHADDAREASVSARVPMSR